MFRTISRLFNNAHKHHPSAVHNEYDVNKPLSSNPTVETINFCLFVILRTTHSIQLVTYYDQVKNETVTLIDKMKRGLSYATNLLMFCVLPDQIVTISLYMWFVSLLSNHV